MMGAAGKSVQREQQETVSGTWSAAIYPKVAVCPKAVVCPRLHSSRWLSCPFPPFPKSWSIQHLLDPKNPASAQEMGTVQSSPGLLSFINPPRRALPAAHCLEPPSESSSSTGGLLISAEKRAAHPILGGSGISCAVQSHWGPHLLSCHSLLTGVTLWPTDLTTDL